MSPLEHTAPTRPFRCGLVVAVDTAVIGWPTVVLLVISPPSSGTPHDPVGQPATSPASASPAVKPWAGASATVALPSSAPGDVTCTLMGQAAVPISASARRYRVDGCRATGYVRTHIGALIGAAQICTRSGFYAERFCWEPTLTSQLLRSTDRDAPRLLIDADARKAPGTAPGQPALLAGFRYLSYIADSAAVGLIRCGTHGTYARTTLALIWTGEDGKPIAPPAGQRPALTTSRTSMARTVPQGAQ